MAHEAKSAAASAQTRKSHDAAATPAERLATPVQFMRGVGAARAALLAKLELHTARDVLFFFPRSYIDLARVEDVGQLEDGQQTRLRGRVIEVEERATSRGSMLGALVRCGGGSIQALWFNQGFLSERLKRDQELLLSGKPRFKGGSWQMVHPQVQWLETEFTGPQAELQPVYPLTEGLKQHQIRRIVADALEEFAPLLDEVFPPEFLESHNLALLGEALANIHFPPSQALLDRARKRLVYQELLVLQLALALQREERMASQIAVPLPATPKIDARIRRLFPFELTKDQNQAIAEVATDMALGHPMNRLLQGEVGSGKTVIALYALLLAVAHGQQAALMAPTEVLARQHAETLGRVLSASHVRWRLLSGSLTATERAQTIAEVQSGELDVVVGTHAILQEDVNFARLALVVIDEQHKFGVRQRALLKNSATQPHYLVMTATPICRTLTMAQFGDLEVSTLHELPPGRQKVNTYLATPDQRDAWWDFFGKKLRAGRQGYVVAPRVDEDEQAELASAAEAYEALANGPLEAFRLGLLHGRMPPGEKDDVMRRFRSGELQVLVATTVVEVGIDVPNATLMTIESGQRFGLAQLHQLRGRVSRGSSAGFCCVFADLATAEARSRLEAFVRTTDGFELAELDFQLRGPGDLLGTRQHGLPPLRIADLARDGELLDQARRDALALVAADRTLSQPEHARLRRMVLVRYGHALQLGDVG